VLSLTWNEARGSWNAFG